MKLRHAASVQRAIVEDKPGSWEESILAIDADGYAVCRSEEIARRIIACVNACNGLPTEELETYGLMRVKGKLVGGFHTTYPFFCPKCGNAHDASIMCKPTEDSPEEWAKGGWHGKSKRNRRSS